MQYAVGSLLAQSRPSGTAAVQAVANTLPAEITTIVVCNTSTSTANFSIYHSNVGSLYDETTALHFEQAIAAKTTVIIETTSRPGGITISRDGTLGVQSSVASALTFSIYGLLESAGRK